MKKGWTYKPLGEVCDLYQPQTISKKDMVTNGEYNVFGANGIIGKYDKYNHELPEILMTCRGATCGNINVSTPKSWINGNAMVVHIKDESVINKLFLTYILSYIDKSKIITGAAQPQITRQTLYPLEICYPNLYKQEQIVEYLDKAFEDIDTLKDNSQKQLDDARKLFQAALTEAMQPKEGWKMKSIGALFKTYSGGTPIKSEKSYYEKGTIPWLRSGEVCRKYITKCEMYITEEGVKNSSAKYFPVNTLLVAMYGATAAQVGILKFRATSNQAVCGILPSKEFVPEYVYYWFKHIENDLASQAQGGAQPNISQQKIKKVEIPIISISEQQEIVQKLDALSDNMQKLEEINRKVIAECDALKQSILRQIFE